MGHGSSRGVLLGKEPWELLSTGRIFGLLLATLLAVVASASASDLVGTVTNGTTNKPAAGDEVVLLTLSNGGMSESVGAKTDSAGRFRFTLVGLPGPRLVRVVHQGVTYDKTAEAVVNLVALRVYDVADKLDGVRAVMDVQRFEARSDTLEVKQLVTMRNDSRPPRTLMNDRAFEIQLPPEAEVESGLVQIEDGKPLKQKPTPGDHRGEYYFRSPLRPGDTRFAVIYRLPYNGEAVIEPMIRNPLEQFVVMLPLSMKFEPKAAGIFQPMPNVSPDNVQGTAPMTPGQTLAFRISGTGMLAELRSDPKDARSGKTERPGGQRQARGGETANSGTTTVALIKLPDALHRRDQFVLGGLAAVLTVGSVYYFLYVKRRSAVARARKRSIT